MATKEVKIETHKGEKKSASISDNKSNKQKNKSIKQRNKEKNDKEKESKKDSQNVLDPVELLFN